MSYVLVIGATNVDILATAHGPLALGDSNPGRIRYANGGVARNVAENLARLGLGTHLLSAVGDDVLGHNVLAATRQAGVNVDACWTLPDAATSTYISLHSSDGDMAVAVNDMDIVERINPALLTTRIEQLQLASIWVLDCNLTEEALTWICKLDADQPIFVDGVSAFKCLRIRSLLHRIHTLKLNQLEARTLSGMQGTTAADMQAISHWLHLQGVQQVVISLGDQGLYWSSQHAGHGTLGALPCKVVNITGAGDALLAGLVYAYLQHQPLPQAAQFARACATLTLGCEEANHPGLSIASITPLLSS